MANNIEKLGLLREILEEIESNLGQAKKTLGELLGGPSASKKPKISEKEILKRAEELSKVEGRSRIIQGVFNGQNMVAPDGAEYPVPANYASKSKIVQGDTLKLTITEDGSFIYKQIGPVPRKKVLGILHQDEKGDFEVVTEGKTYKVLLASVTYFKGEVGDEVTLVVPAEGESEWGAIENIIKKKGPKEIVENKQKAEEKEEGEKEVLPGQIVDDLDTDIEDNLEGLVEEERE